MATYRELLEQRKELDRQLQAAHKAEMADAIAKVKELMAQYDLKIEDIAPAKGKGRSSSTKGTKVAAKYRNPETGDTWTGRGRQPKWVEAALASGKALEDLAV